MNETTYYRHWYITIDEDDYKEQKCSGWVDKNWYEYANSNHRNECDGWGNLSLLETDKRVFKNQGELYR